MSRFERGDRERGREKGMRVNREITAPQVRLIADDGSMVGVLTINEAIRKAEEAGLDLIEIVPNATPPTCKLMDFGKFKYEQKKKTQVSKKKQVIIDIKEIQLRPRTDQHDLETKLRHARRFIEEGDKVKFNVRFRGREAAYQKTGEEVLKKMMEGLQDLALVEVPPKMEGKQLFALIAPDPTKIKEKKKASPKPASTAGAEPAAPKAKPKSAGKSEEEPDEESDEES